MLREWVPSNCLALIARAMLRIKLVGTIGADQFLGQSDWKFDSTVRYKFAILVTKTYLVGFRVICN